MSDIRSVVVSCEELSPAVTSLLVADDVTVVFPLCCGDDGWVFVSADPGSCIEDCRIAASSGPNSSSRVGNRTVTSGVESDRSTGIEISRCATGYRVVSVNHKQNYNCNYNLGNNNDWTPRLAQISFANIVVPCMLLRKVACMAIHIRARFDGKL